MAPTTSSSNGERTPLLPGSNNSNNASGHGSSLLGRRNSHIHLSGQPGNPTYAESFKSLILYSPINILLLAVPFSFASHFAGWGATATFITSFLAIVPLAGLLGEATEQVSLRLGQTLGGLLNATFGNAVEAIVGIVALSQNQLRIVQTSMLGSVLSNLLLVLGMSFWAAGKNYKQAKFQVTAAQTNSGILMLAGATLIIPAAYHASSTAKKPPFVSIPGGGTLTKEALINLLTTGATSIADDDVPGSDGDLKGLLVISRATAIILLLMYIGYLYFQLHSHADLFEAEIEEEAEAEVAKMNPVAAVISLIGVTLVTAFCADYLVESIDEFSERLGVPKVFIGIILLPIVGNAAEHLTAVWMAMKGKMEITLGVAIGSSIQIAVGVVPLLVLVSWAMGRELTLFFENFETICFFISILLVNVVVGDGLSNYYEGMMLVSLYIVMAVAFWVY
ncbi:calcium/proton exchanger [Cystobasidium minutum MCA 4210]|uniref:calcium/proton exchanger n=1 Tax=Cystobasidium minutum MCA 4210 TaxID=1397322 RepID=UPI0034CD4BD0|eukprot:jgi/Rhomi1/82092/CE82091_5950